MRSRYDAIVVGAGPAGASAALHLASRGSTVLLIDKQRFPRPKACGDGLTPRAISALARLGLADFVAKQVRIDGHCFVDERDGKRSVRVRRFERGQYGAVIPRSVLDEEIRCAAVAAGAEFLDGAPVGRLFEDARGGVRGVVVECNGHADIVRSRFVLVADGGAGMLGKRIRRCGSTGTPGRGVATRQYWKHVEGLSPYFEIHVPLVDRGGAQVGYAWVFPAGGDVANVGLGFVRGFAERVPPIGSVLRGFTERLRERDPRFARAVPCAPAAVGVVATHVVDATGLPKGVLLLGDAARLVNPYTGEGIAYALESGELAADNVALALGGRRRWGAVSYARSLSTKFPRHRAMGGSMWYLRWIASNGVPRSRETTRVVEALWDFVGDQAPRACAHSLLPVGRAGHDIQRKVDRTHERVVTALGKVDPMLGHVLAYVVGNPDAPAAIPTIVAHAIACGRHPPLRGIDDAIVTVACFTFAHALLDDVEDGPARDRHPSNTVAILLGDCLVAEGIGVLQRLQRSGSMPLLRALTDAAGARVGHGAAVEQASRFESLAAPAVALADYVARALRLDRGDRRRALEFARWYATIATAALEYRREQTPDARAALRRLLDRRCLHPSSVFRELSAHLATTAARLVEEPCAVSRHCATP